MEHYRITLDRKQYAVLEKMLSYDNAQCLAMSQPISGYGLFSDMAEDIYSPVEDGWSTLEAVLEESAEKISLLRTLTSLIYPDDADLFVRQVGNDDIICRDDIDILIDLRSMEK